MNSATPCRKINNDGVRSQYKEGRTKTNMNIKQKTTKGRIALLTVIVLLLATLLVGCGGKQAKVELTISETFAQADGGNLTAEQLKNTATLLKTVYDDKEFDVRDMLIAANRGHDMLAEGFDDSKIDPNTEGGADRVASALKVLRRANEKAGDAKISEENFVNLNEKDLQALVGCIQTKVEIEAKSGLWDGILRAVGTCLNWITTYLGFGSYIVGICIFAIIVELLMLPFAVKQQKNSIRQAQLRPKEMAIRNKYKGRTDQVTQQKVQQEIQDLYQRENFSPYSGCLQLFLQFPILIALYQIVIDPLHYVLGQSAGISVALNSYYTAARAAGGLGFQAASSTIELLSGTGISSFEGIQNFQYFTNGSAVWESIKNLALPNFNIFGINFGLNPSFDRFDWLLLVPVLTFVIYFFSMRLSRKFTYQPTQQEGATDRQTACSNTMMDVSMPAMSTFFAFMVPGIIGVYWMFRSVIGTLKQFIMSRVMPLPQFTEADYKAAAREMAGKAPKVQKSERAGKVRSLHHIDDEDFDDTRDRALAHKAAMEEEARRKQEEKAKKSPFAQTEMKKDRADEAEKKEDAAEVSADETEKEDGQK